MVFSLKVSDTSGAALKSIGNRRLLADSILLGLMGVYILVWDVNIYMFFSK